MAAVAGVGLPADATHEDATDALSDDALNAFDRLFDEPDAGSRETVVETEGPEQVTLEVSTVLPPGRESATGEPPPSADREVGSGAAPPSEVRPRRRLLQRVRSLNDENRGVFNVGCLAGSV